MPFLSHVAEEPHYRQVRERLQAESAEQAKRDRMFKIRFSICLLASVFIGSFLFTVVVTL